MNRRELIAAAGAICVAPACMGSTASVGTPGAPDLLASLRIGPVQGGAGNHRWARIESGHVVGIALRGVATGGRVDWYADPATGSVEVAIECSVVHVDGSQWMLRDRSPAPAADGITGVAGIPSAPRLSGTAGLQPACLALAGRIDPRHIAKGVMELRAYDPARGLAAAS